MHVKILNFIFFIFLITFQIAFAQKEKKKLLQNEPIFVLDSPQEYLNLEKTSLPILIDAQANMTIEQIIQPENQYKFQLTKIRNEKLVAKTAYWLRLNFKSKLLTDSDWILSLGKVTNLQVYLPRKDGKFELKEGGQFVPTSRKDVKTGRYNSVNLFLPAQSEIITIYIRFENQVDFPPDPKVVLLHKAEWQENMIWSNLVQGFFQGLVWMMLLYNFLLFLTMGGKTYVYYVFYCFTISIYFLDFYGYWGEFVLGEFPIFNYLFVPFTAHIGFVFYTFFLRSFLQTKQEMPAFDNILKGLGLILVILSIFLMGLAAISYENYLWLEKIYYLIVFGVFLIVLLFVFRFADSAVKYLVMGTSFLLLGVMFLLLGALDILKLHSNIFYFQMGCLLELFMFSLALGERNKQVEKDKRLAQKNLIAQLYENEQLTTKVNRELEEKVKERTAEIEKQKEELMSQSEEIQTQRDDILKKSDILLTKNKHITDSINYASRIQQAILDSAEEVEDKFKAGFIFFQPKDVVSGDFYWYSEMQAITPHVQKVAQMASEGTNGGYSQYEARPSRQMALTTLKIIVAADCTGHGVPGAFMTVLGSSLLNEIINENRIIEPDRILQELDKRVIQTLKRQSVQKQLSDGMDIIVLVYDEDNRKLSYSGAKNPLYYVRDYEIHQINASKHSIGYSHKEQYKHFEKHIIDVKDDDIFYLTSDGFEDQFGETTNRKYMKKNMRNFFLKISHLPLQRQKEVLRNEFEMWKGSLPQTDDIVVMGIKF